MKRLSIFTLLCLVFSNVGLSYVLPSRFIVNQVVETKRFQKNLWVKSVVKKVEDGKVRKEVLFTDITFYDALGRKFASQAYYGGKKIYSIVRESAPPLAVDVLFNKSTAALIGRLKSEGIPVRTEKEWEEIEDEEDKKSVARVERWNRDASRLVWSIGESGKMIQIEKRTFHPASLYADGVRIDFEKYRKYKGYDYPGLIQLVDGGKPIYAVELQKILIDSEKKWRKLKKTGWTDAGDDAPSDVRAAVDAYYRYIK